MAKGSSKGGGKPTNKHVTPKDENGNEYTVSSWLKENSKYYQYSDFTVVNKDNTIILDDRIAYLKSRSKEYMQSFRRAVRGRTVYDIKVSRPGNGEVVTLVLNDLSVKKTASKGTKKSATKKKK